MASNAAVPFWRSAGMTYISYSNLCANLVRQCLKEPYRSESLNREKVHFAASQWVDGKPEKPIKDEPEVSLSKLRNLVVIFLFLVLCLEQSLIPLPFVLCLGYY
ncbi:hypothetical protein ACJIZ3_021060 [Penstemon smallii]|uniref:ATP synthase subunit epsilon, mitochondrial n=1 Tax=Penstemon smallii TaxID=265156 RepID=A0ABD3SKW3_9LAMI